MDEQQWPASLQEIIDMFADALPEDRLDLLREFALSMPDVSEEVGREAMEQVHECQTPVFLASRLENNRVYYVIDVPREAPTVRGFANILYEGLNGATPEAIAATPNDLYVRLGLHQVLSPLRLRGLTALLGRMKRTAHQLAASA